MELGLSLGDPSKPLKFIEKSSSRKQKPSLKNGGFDFCMALGLKTYSSLTVIGNEDGPVSESEISDENKNQELNLLPISPAPRRISLPWSSDYGSSENGSSGNVSRPAATGFGVSRFPAEEVTSANSHLDFGVHRGGGVKGCGGKRDFEEALGNDVVLDDDDDDEDENGLNNNNTKFTNNINDNNRKKLRLSKEQSAFLEESFKEHNTLNPKQKQGLAKQLNLRPRQVEVWFQNRRARTKLKQTEVDCEYLKRCCETLSDENRRLQKELQELRALNKNSNPFYMQLPATTLTMCPSCERVATTAKILPFPLINGPKFFPFSQNPIHPNQPAAS